jgi:glycosyltransferase involved in cell wall biosynthesis
LVQLRIAIVSQFSSPGGGARFLRCLCLGLVGSADVDEVALFTDASAADRDGLLSLLPASDRMSLHLLDGTGHLVGERSEAPKRPQSKLRMWARRQSSLVRAYRAVRRIPPEQQPDPNAPSLHRVALSNAVVEAISAFDVAYFPWPRLVVPPDAPSALVATFHDFNHRHMFGNFHPADAALLDEEMVEWLSGRVLPISSSRFIRDELDAYYPTRTNEPEVVYLSSFAVHDPTPDEVASVLALYGLPERFVLCPTNIGPHKNLISLLRAAGALKRAGVEMRLVLTGSGTECLGVDPAGHPLYGSVFKQPIDDLNTVIADDGLIVGVHIWPLGYVPDAHMDALTRGAHLLVAPSRYEAGSGPALDAWSLGTPVASSILPPVLEQIAFLGTEAALFEPTDVDGIVCVLSEMLRDDERLRAMAERSCGAMSAHGWDEVAAGYVRVFSEAIRRAAARRDGEASGPSVPCPQPGTRKVRPS